MGLFTCVCDFAAGHSEQGEDGELEVRKHTEQQNEDEKDREEDGEEGIQLTNARFNASAFSFTECVHFHTTSFISFTFVLYPTMQYISSCDE